MLHTSSISKVLEQHNHLNGSVQFSCIISQIQKSQGPQEESSFQQWPVIYWHYTNSKTFFQWIYDFQKPLMLLTLKMRKMIQLSGIIIFNPLVPKSSLSNNQNPLVKIIIIIKSPLIPHQIANSPTIWLKSFLQATPLKKLKNIQPPPSSKG